MCLLPTQTLWLRFVGFVGWVMLINCLKFGRCVHRFRRNANGRCAVLLVKLEALRRARAFRERARSW